MNRYKAIYHIILIALLSLTACQSDENAEQRVGLQPNGKVRFHLNVGVAGSPATRAWSDASNATDKEMMNVWTVVVVNNNDNKVTAIYACKPSGEPDQEIDQIDKSVELSEGTYRFYSFANMSPEVVKRLILDPDEVIGGGPARTRAGDDDSNNGSNNGNENSSASAGNSYQSSGDAVSGVVASYVSQAGSTGAAEDEFYTNDNTYKKNEIYSIDFAEGKKVTAAKADAREVNVKGNNFDVEENNIYGAKGIPMSNVQTITISESTTSVDLVVIRMMAKIEIQVYNDGANNATISSISLTEITKNANDNLKLLPKLTVGHDLMEFKHQDIRPNLGTAGIGNMTLYPTAVQGLVDKDNHKSGKLGGTKGTPVKFVFYVNESDKPANGSGLFYLTLGIKTGSGEDLVYSHALISDTDGKEWGYIARNDYRVIPIVLTDWQFRIEPIAFVPIAGYPAVLLSSDAQKATFSTGGMIALQPFVKKRTETTWRDFDDSEVNPGVGTSWNESITWKNDNGSKVSGTDNIIKTPFTYDPVTKYIIGELNNDLSVSKKTAVTITMKLGTAPNQYTYSFTCDVNLQK